jgi:hypothetical protein
MSNPPLFKDLGKKINDLFNKDYPLNEKKLEWKGESQGVTIETNFSLKGENIIGTVTPKYKYGRYGLNFLGEVNTRKDLKAEVSADDVAPGLKATITGQSKGSEVFGTVATEYKHEYATITTAVELGRPAGTTVRSSVVVSPGVKNLAVGASAEYLVGTAEESDLKELNTTIHYSTRELELGLFGRMKNAESKHEVGANFYHQVNSASGVAGEMVFDAHHTDRKPKLMVGLHHKWSADAIIKSKFDTSGQLGFSYQQLFPNQAKLTVGTSVDVNNLSEKTTKFGVALSFGF